MSRDAEESVVLKHPVILLRNTAMIRDYKYKDQFNQLNAIVSSRMLSFHS